MSVPHSLCVVYQHIDDQHITNQPLPADLTQFYSKTTAASQEPNNLSLRTATPSTRSTSLSGGSSTDRLSEFELEIIHYFIHLFCLSEAQFSSIVPLISPDVFEKLQSNDYDDEDGLFLLSCFKKMSLALPHVFFFHGITDIQLFLIYLSFAIQHIDRSLHLLLNRCQSSKILPEDNTVTQMNSQLFAMHQPLDSNSPSSNNRATQQYQESLSHIMFPVDKPFFHFPTKFLSNFKSNPTSSSFLNYVNDPTYTTSQSSDNTIQILLFSQVYHLKFDPQLALLTLSHAGIAHQSQLGVLLHPHSISVITLYDKLAQQLPTSSQSDSSSVLAQFSFLHSLSSFEPDIASLLVNHWPKSLSHLSRSTNIAASEQNTSLSSTSHQSHEDYLFLLWHFDSNHDDKNNTDASKIRTMASSPLSSLIPANTELRHCIFPSRFINGSTTPAPSLPTARLQNSASSLTVTTNPLLLLQKPMPPVLIKNATSLYRQPPHHKTIHPQPGRIVMNYLPFLSEINLKYIQLNVPQLSQPSLAENPTTASVSTFPNTQLVLPPISSLDVSIAPPTTKVIFERFVHYFSLLEQWFSPQRASSPSVDTPHIARPICRNDEIMIQFTFPWQSSTSCSELLSYQLEQCRQEYFSSITSYLPILSEQFHPSLSLVNFLLNLDSFPDQPSTAVSNAFTSHVGKSPFRPPYDIQNLQSPIRTSPPFARDLQSLQSPTRTSSNRSNNHRDTEHPQSNSQKLASQFDSLISPTKSLFPVSHRERDDNDGVLLTAPPFEQQHDRSQHQLSQSSFLNPHEQSTSGSDPPLGQQRGDDDSFEHSQLDTSNDSSQSSQNHLTVHHFSQHSALQDSQISHKNTLYTVHKRRSIGSITFGSTPATTVDTSNSSTPPTQTQNTSSRRRVLRVVKAISLKQRNKQQQQQPNTPHLQTSSNSSATTPNTPSASKSSTQATESVTTAHLQEEQEAVTPPFESPDTAADVIPHKTTSHTSLPSFVSQLTQNTSQVPQHSSSFHQLESTADANPFEFHPSNQNISSSSASLPIEVRDDDHNMQSQNMMQEASSQTAPSASASALDFSQPIEQHAVSCDLNFPCYQPFIDSMDFQQTSGIMPILSQSDCSSSQDMTMRGDRHVRNVIATLNNNRDIDSSTTTSMSQGDSYQQQDEFIAASQVLHSHNNNNTSDNTNTNDDNSSVSNHPSTMTLDLPHQPSTAALFCPSPHETTNNELISGQSFLSSQPHRSTTMSGLSSSLNISSSLPCISETHTVAMANDDENVSNQDITASPDHHHLGMSSASSLHLTSSFQHGVEDDVAQHIDNSTNDAGTLIQEDQHQSNTQTTIGQQHLVSQNVSSHREQETEVHTPLRQSQQHHSQSQSQPQDMTQCTPSTQMARVARNVLAQSQRDNTHSQHPNPSDLVAAITQTPARLSFSAIFNTNIFPELFAYEDEGIPGLIPISQGPRSHSSKNSSSMGTTKQHRINLDQTTAMPCRSSGCSSSTVSSPKSSSQMLDTSSQPVLRLRSLSASSCHDDRLDPIDFASGDDSIFRSLGDNRLVSNEGHESRIIGADTSTTIDSSQPDASPAASTAPVAAAPTCTQNSIDLTAVSESTSQTSASTPTAVTPTIMTQETPASPQSTHSTDEELPITSNQFGISSNLLSITNRPKQQLTSSSLFSVEPVRSLETQKNQKNTILTGKAKNTRFDLHASSSMSQPPVVHSLPTTIASQLRSSSVVIPLTASKNTPSLLLRPINTPFRSLSQIGTSTSIAAGNHSMTSSNTVSASTTEHTHESIAQTSARKFPFSPQQSRQGLQQSQSNRLSRQSSRQLTDFFESSSSSSSDMESNNALTLRSTTLITQPQYSQSSTSNTNHTQKATDTRPSPVPDDTSVDSIHFVTPVKASTAGDMSSIHKMACLPPHQVFTPDIILPDSFTSSQTPRSSPKSQSSPFSIHFLDDCAGELNAGRSDHGEQQQGTQRSSTPDNHPAVGQSIVQQHLLDENCNPASSGDSALDHHNPLPGRSNTLPAPTTIASRHLALPTVANKQQPSPAGSNNWANKRSNAHFSPYTPNKKYRAGTNSTQIQSLIDQLVSLDSNNSPRNSENPVLDQSIDDFHDLNSTPALSKNTIPDVQQPTVVNDDQLSFASQSDSDYSPFNYLHLHEPSEPSDDSPPAAHSGPQWDALADQDDSDDLFDPDPHLNASDVSPSGHQQMAHEQKNNSPPPMSAAHLVEFNSVSTVNAPTTTSFITLAEAAAAMGASTAYISHVESSPQNNATGEKPNDHDNHNDTTMDDDVNNDYDDQDDNDMQHITCRVVPNKHPTLSARVKRSHSSFHHDIQVDVVTDSLHTSALNESSISTISTSAGPPSIDPSLTSVDATSALLSTRHFQRNDDVLASATIDPPLPPARRTRQRNVAANPLQPSAPVADVPSGYELPTINRNEYTKYTLQLESFALSCAQSLTERDNARQKWAVALQATWQALSTYCSQLPEQTPWTPGDEQNKLLSLETISAVVLANPTMATSASTSRSWWGSHFSIIQLIDQPSLTTLATQTSFICQHKECKEAVRPFPSLAALEQHIRTDHPTLRLCKQAWPFQQVIDPNTAQRTVRMTQQLCLSLMTTNAFHMHKKDHTQNYVHLLCGRVLRANGCVDHLHNSCPFLAKPQQNARSSVPSRRKSGPARKNLYVCPWPHRCFGRAERHFDNFCEIIIHYHQSHVVAAYSNHENSIIDLESTSDGDDDDIEAVSISSNANRRQNRSHRSVDYTIHVDSQCIDYLQDFFRVNTSAVGRHFLAIHNLQPNYIGQW